VTKKRLQKTKKKRRGFLDPLDTFVGCAAAYEQGGKEKSDKKEEKKRRYIKN